jgi:hypothetical protein
MIGKTPGFTATTGATCWSGVGCCVGCADGGAGVRLGAVLGLAVAKGVGAFAEVAGALDGDGVRAAGAHPAARRSAARINRRTS